MCDSLMEWVDDTFISQYDARMFQKPDTLHRVQGSGLRAQSSRLRAHGSGLRVWCLMFVIRFGGLGPGAWGLGLGGPRFQSIGGSTPSTGSSTPSSGYRCTVLKVPQLFGDMHFYIRRFCSPPPCCRTEGLGFRVPQAQAAAAAAGHIPSRGFRVHGSTAVWAATRHTAV